MSDSYPPNLDPSPVQILADNVARLRHEVHWTTRAFADHTGLTLMTLHEIEHAKYKTISLDTLERLAKGFGVHWAVLLGASDVLPQPPLSESIRDTVAAALIRCRAQRAVTQDMLSKNSGVNRSMISDIERRARNVSLTILERLAGALEVPLTDLLT